MSDAKRHTVTLLSEIELRELLALDPSVVDAVADAFRALATEAVVMPPILAMELPEHEGSVDVKTACIPGWPSFVVKVSTGFFANPDRGLPSLNGLMVAFDAMTGQVRAVLLDNGYLTALRTAAAGAVAARHLAPQRVRSAAVLGSGLQARLQAQAAHLVRPFGQVYVWGRDASRAARCAQDIAAATGARADVAASAAEAVGAAELAITTTPAAAPILGAECLHPGLHVTAMGADAPTKNELEPAVLGRADLYVCDRVSQCAARGELRAAIEAGIFAADAAHSELGEIVAGRRPGRRSEAAITVCDLTGTGAQDTAIASLALERAAASGSGRRIEA